MAPTPLQITVLALCTRILIALCTRTFFQPDEYFQSLEPAYRFVYGYGHLTWEWSTNNGDPIRSVIYPALNVPVYWMLKVTGLDTDTLLIAAPKVLHGTLAALTDIWVCKLTRKLFGERYVAPVLFMSLTSPFHALALSRSFSNSFETSLTTIAFFYFPWDLTRIDASTEQQKSLRRQMRKSLCFAAIACAVRPTNSIIWVYLCLVLQWKVVQYPWLGIKLIGDLFWIGVPALVVLFATDSYYHGKPTLTPLNFVKTNLFSPVSSFYGINTWHYYLTQGLPILCGIILPFSIKGFWKIWNDKRLATMSSVVIFTICTYSTATHKEWRFLHPLLPLLHIFGARSLVDLGVNKSKNKKTAHIRKTHLWLSISIPVCLFVVLFYCSAPISVMSYLRHLPREDLERGGVGFLMPCHSTPWQAYLHRPRAKIWALGCEPPLGNQILTAYRDQTDIFYNSPQDYLLRHFPEAVDRSFPQSPFPSNEPGDSASTAWKHEWPERLVFFGELLKEPGLEGLLTRIGYKQVWRKGFDWEGEGNRKGGVRVWQYLENT